MQLDEKKKLPDARRARYENILDYSRYSYSSISVSSDRLRQVIPLTFKNYFVSYAGLFQTLAVGSVISICNHLIEDIKKIVA
jgi:hypothetical protein